MNAEQRKQAVTWVKVLMNPVGTGSVPRGDAEIAALLRAGIAASERLEDFEEDFRAVVNEECAPDEKHCSCVPHLKRALKQASEECERLQKERDQFFAIALNPLDAEKPCVRCAGRGRIVYASTATFWGGIGGASMTAGVCNVCWGSGDEWNRNPDLRNTRGAWLAAWDAEWHRQFETMDLCDLATDYRDACIANTRLRALLGHAAGLLDKTSALFFANGKDCGGRLSTNFAEQYAAEFAKERLALLAEIEGAK